MRLSTSWVFELSICINPFAPKILSVILLTFCHRILMMSVQRIWFWIKIDRFLYSQYLSAWYCLHIVRRNSVLHTSGSERVKWWSQSFNVFNLNQTVVEKVEFCSFNTFCCPQTTKNISVSRCWLYRTMKNHCIHFVSIRNSDGQKCVNAVSHITFMSLNFSLVFEFKY